METTSPSSQHQDAESTCEELSLQEGLLFSDGLKDLRSLRSQLYSAAEYFEVFYRNDAEKPTVLTSLKDYTVQALVSTIDHLGFVSHEVNDRVNEKVDEVMETEFRVSSVEQRVRTCQEIIDQEGRSQQSLVIKAPKYHKHYILPGDTIDECAITPVTESPRYNRPVLHRKTRKLQTAISPPSSREPTLRKTRSQIQSHSNTQRSGSLSPSREAQDPSLSPSLSSSPRVVNSDVKEKSSPIPKPSALARSVSVSRRPSFSNLKNITQTSVWNSPKGTDGSTNKSKGFLKSLLTRRRWRNDESLYSYLDEY